MRKAVKRIFVLLLCVTLLVEGNVTHAFCAEVDNVSDVSNEENGIIEIDSGETESFENETNNDSEIQAEEVIVSEDDGEEEMISDTSEETSEEVGDTSEEKNTSDEETEEESIESDVNEKEIAFGEGEIELQGEELVYTPEGETYSLKYEERTSATYCNIHISGWSGNITGKVVIPSTINGHPVTGINEGAFKDCNGLTNVEVPTGTYDGYFTVGRKAFENCTNLISVKMPKVSFRYYAFYNCTNLESVESSCCGGIEDYAFYGCSKLTSIGMLKEISEIGAYAFYGCNSLTHIEIPNTVTEIHEYSFAYCSSLESINIPKGVTRIYDYSFGFCSSLTSIVIPDGVTEIGWAAFGGCSSLTSINIPYGVREIGSSAFAETAITNITIPNSVSEIGYAAFGGCSNLVNITIPDSVKYIYNDAFYGCSSLASVNISKNITEIWSGTFGSCKTLESLSIPNNVVKIGVGDSPYGAFEDCSNLTSIEIPDNVEELGENTFKGCTSLTSIVIPNSVTSIGDGVFANCTSLTSIVIPNNVTSIGYETFANCSSLKRIELSSKVEEIDDYAFRNCVKNKLVFYCEKDSYAYKWAKSKSYKVKTLGDGPEQECGDDAVWKYSNGVLTISGEGATYNYDSISELPWYEYHNKVETIIVEDGITYIGKNILENYEKLRRVQLPSSLSWMNLLDYFGGPGIWEVVYKGTKSQFSSILGSTFLKDSKYMEKAWIVCSDGIYQNGNSFSGNFYYQNFDSRTAYYKYKMNSDVFFDGSRDKYNHDLSRMSLKVAMSSYDTGEHGKNGAKNITRLMDDMKFAYDNSSVNYDDASDDSIGSAIGYRKIYDSETGESTYVVLVAIRSGNYGREWSSNLWVGENGNHYGFEDAADKVGGRLYRFVKTHSAELGNNYKIWIAGYSRGAATANVLAHNLNYDKYGLGNNPNNIYTYCFECPRTTESSNNIGYNNNIFNIVNPQDPITRVPMSSHGWNFKRYGYDICLPEYEESRFYDKLYDILTYSGAYSGGQVHRYFYIPDAWYIDQVENALSRTLVNRGAYVRFNQKDYMRDINRLVDGSENPFLSILVSNIFGQSVFHFAFGDAGVSTILQNLVFQKNINDILKSHDTELHLAIMESLSESDIWRQQGYRYIYFNCPIDIVIKNENGDVVGKFVDDEAIEIENGIDTFVDFNGQKVAILPDDEYFSIEIEATDDGEMTYSVAEKSSYYEGANRITVFSGIDIHEGDSLSGSAAAKSDEPIDYDLALNGEELQPEVITDTEAMIKEIKVNIDGNGSVYGGTSVNVGEFDMLSAVPDEFEQFKGWYLGEELVSSETDYRFEVKEDIELTAKFTGKTNGLWINSIEEGKIYTGTAVKPQLEVYCGNNLLTGSDYTVSYKNNTNAFTLAEGDDGFEAVKSKAPTITIKGKGNYSGSETLYFIIEPKSLEDEDIVMAEIGALPYSTKVQKPSPAVNWGKKKLAANKDYTISYYSSKDEGITVTDDVIMISDSATAIEPKDGGTYYVRAVGKGNYKGEIIQSFVIAGNDEKPVNKLTIGKIANKPFDNGNEIKPVVEIKDGRDKLTEGEHYTVEYRNNTDVGTASVIVTGLGKYVGTKTVNFQITGTAIKSTKITIPKSSMPYADGAPVTQDITVSMKNNPLTGIEASVYAAIENEAERRQYDYTYEYKDNIYPGKASVVFTGINGYTGTITKNFTITGINISKLQIGNLKTAYVYTGEEIEQEGLTFKLKPSAKEPEINLERDADFTIAYTNNQKAGTATMVITGVNGYTGTVKKSFKINPYPITPKDDTSDKFKVEFTDGAAVYEKSGSKPKPEVTFNGELLTEGKDYKLSYSNNSAVNDCTGTKKPTITVTGMGNFKGSDNTCIFVIEARNIGDGSVAVSAPDKVATGKKGAWKSTVTLTDTSGKKLAVGKDYLKNIEYTYEAIEGTVLDGSKKTPDAVTREIGDKVEDSDIVPAGTKIKITATGTGNYNETVEGSYRIVTNDINKLTVTLNPKTYTGKAIKVSPEEITFKSGKNVLTLAEGVDYEILEDSYKNNINKGKATFEIRGLGNYGGTKKITFTIGQKGFIWWWRNLSNL